MDWYRRHTDRTSHPQLFKAGFWGVVAFDALCDVSAEFDLGGTIPKQYTDPAWLAARVNLTSATDLGASSETPETRFTRFISEGLVSAVSAGLLTHLEDGSIAIDGWERRQPKVPKKSTERVRKHRARAAETQRNAVKHVETYMESEKESEKERKETTMSAAPTARAPVANESREVLAMASVDPLPQELPLKIEVEPVRPEPPPPLRPPAPPPRETGGAGGGFPLVNGKLSSAVREVFEYWRRIMHHPSAQLDSARLSKIEARLKGGYSVDQLKQAIDGCSKTPHNMGENDRGQKYDALTLILRDADHVDRFIANAQHEPTAIAWSKS